MAAFQTHNLRDVKVEGFVPLTPLTSNKIHPLSAVIINRYSNCENSWIRSCHKHPLCHLQPHSDVYRALLTAACKLPAGSILPITCLDDHIKTLFSSECLSPGCCKSVSLWCRFLSICLEWNGPLHKNGVSSTPLIFWRPQTAGSWLWLILTGGEQQQYSLLKSSMF